jgi:hypothetical protein
MQSSGSCIADVQIRGLLVGAIFICSGCGQRDEAADSLMFFPQLAKHVSQAGELTVYEGLPHPSMDAVRYNEELQRAETVEIDGHRFYKTPVAVSADAIEGLRELLTDHRRFRALPPDAAKACGGFHPDWLLIWSAGGKKMNVHVCFGCGEVAAFVDGRRQMLCEMTDDQPFQNALLPLATNLAPRTE